MTMVSGRSIGCGAGAVAGLGASTGANGTVI
ncbi:hypothetical protein ACTIVE_1566 [Actinomadura verrucosospora]|uniref:Uncharacterized protein n=1 Tax=Actinomadura verrucosospora TaxID=46165 RepID=A0A7D3VQL7_ACTVE|nr:hypothetical protein ACTIVE_1566 [Actinomadura verrucosospora]